MRSCHLELNMFVERVDVNSVSELTREPNGFQKFLNDSSTGKHDDQAQVYINSLDLSNIKNCQKRNKKKQAKKKRKSSGCPIGSLGSIDEGDLSSALGVQDSSVRDISSNHLGKADLAEDGSSIPPEGEISQEKASGGPNNELLSRKKKKKKRKLNACPMTSLGSTEEGASLSVLVVPDSSDVQISSNQLDKVPAPCNLVAGNGTSLLDGGKISQEIASGECPNGESDYGEKEESKIGNLGDNNAGHGRIHQRKKRKSFACSISSFKSIEEGLQESSAGYTCLNHMDEAPKPSYSGKMMEEVVAGLGISQEKASCECPVGEPASGKERKKSKRKNFEKSNRGKSVVMDGYMVDIPETDFEWCNKDKLDVIHNRVLSEEDKASDDALVSVPSVDNIVVDNLDIQPMLNDAIPSSSKLGAIIDSVSLESPQGSSGGAPLGNLRKKLLVLDVNGLLADIVPSVTGGYKPDRVLSQKAVFKRPFCDDFLQFCFDRFHVGVWSSRNRKNVNSVLNFLMGKSKSNLLFCWDQSHCTETGYNTVENREKPLLLKELKNLWEEQPYLPWASGEYNESNTLLLDDSPYKALRNPPNTAIFPQSYCYKNRRDKSLGPGGDVRVYLEGIASADNVQKYVKQNPFGQRPITNMNLSWGFYLKIIGNSSSEQDEDATNYSSACQQGS